MTGGRGVGRVLRVVGVLYLVAVAASWGWRLLGGEAPRPAPADGVEVFELAAVREGDRRGEDTVRLAARVVEGPGPEAPVVVLVHGSPGSGDNFGGTAARPGLVAALAEHARVVVPDLPGFGDSDLDAPDLSFTAHADYLLQLLDALEVPAAHVVGFSMGGGVGLQMWRRAPERVRSLTLLSAIGVQELELLGDHALNHAVHGLQLGAFRFLDGALPHFGRTDGFDRAIAYSRNFFESDQRPLRGLLARFEPPLLVIHGRDDFLVPVEAAEEHHRIAPHSELWLSDAGHFMVFAQRPEFTDALVDFVLRAEAGTAPRRADAGAERVAAAAAPYDPSTAPPASGFLLVVLMVVLAAATLVSEDLTCIAAGLMVARGRLTLLAASAACFVGIFVGDLMLYLAGRLLGRPVVQRAPLRWMITPEALDRSRRWFEQRGATVIVLSRFMPGMRLPTYVAAGVLGLGLLKFCLWFALAGLLWTPTLVALAMVSGRELMEGFGWIEEHPLTGLAFVAGAVLLVVKILVPLTTHRGRRLLYGRWLRLTRWEFWPPWVFYPPLVVYLLWLGLKHRGLALLTAVNPCMPASGIIGESKGDILDHLARELGDEADALPASLRLPARGEDGRPVEAVERLATVERFLEARDLHWPVVLKPDAGQRGDGVLIARDPASALTFLERSPVDLVAQEFVTGPEFGVFAIRRPEDERFHVFSVTVKRRPSVTGDGVRSVEQLLLDDPRAPAMAATYAKNLGARLEDVPEPGVEVPLTDVGAHARGTIFEDGRPLVTPELEARLDALSRRIDGFHFGRYDVIVPSAEHLQRGEGLRVIELNGLTSEATHIYDARTSLLQAYRDLAAQWRLAFAIGAANVARGEAVTPLWRLPGMALGFLRDARRRSGA